MGAEDNSRHKLVAVGIVSITRRMEGNMEQALPAVQLLFYLLGGLGLFFMGIGVLWFVDVYKKKSG
jgi:hypothetical protein